jgi:hypothetical protein
MHNKLRSDLPRNSHARSDHPSVAFVLTVIFSCGIALGLSANAAQKKAPTGSMLVADKGKLAILLDGQSVGHEEFEISPGGGAWTAKGSSSLKQSDGTQATVSGNLTLQPDGAPIAYDWTAQTGKTNAAHFQFVNGVAKMTLQMQGAHAFQQDLTFSSPAIVVLDDNLYHQYAVLARLYDWTKRGSQNFSVLVPQERLPGTITVDSAGAVTAADGKTYDGLKVQTADLQLTLFLDGSHRLMRIEVPAAKVVIVRE